MNTATGITAGITRIIKITNQNFKNAIGLWFARRPICINILGDISNWDVSNVTNMSNAFAGITCDKLDISNWNVSNVTNMSNAFAGIKCNNLDISKWDVSNVTDMSNTFAFAGIENLIKLNISDWDVSKVTNMCGMFRDVNILYINVNNWNTSNVINMTNMFSNIQFLILNARNWNITNVTDMTNMFSNIESLNLDISGWNIKNWNIRKHVNKFLINLWKKEDEHDFVTNNWKLTDTLENGFTDVTSMFDGVKKIKFNIYEINDRFYHIYCNMTESINEAKLAYY